VPPYELRPFQAARRCAKAVELSTVKFSSSKFGWLIPQQVILSVAKDLDGPGDSSLRSE